jgi:hypothetical protein
MPLVTTELSEAEFQKLEADKKTLNAANYGVVMKAALAAFQPTPPPAAEPAPQGEEPHG